jgi:hypothetical protein
MPRYFFDTYDGRFDLIDEEGHELPDRAAARREATRALAEMAADGLSQARSRIFRLQIRDGSGQWFEAEINYRCREIADDSP